MIEYLRKFCEPCSQQRDHLRQHILSEHSDLITWLQCLECSQASEEKTWPIEVWTRLTPTECEQKGCDDPPAPSSTFCLTHHTMQELRAEKSGTDDGCTRCGSRAIPFYANCYTCLLIKRLENTEHKRSACGFKTAAREKRRTHRKQHKLCPTCEGPLPCLKCTSKRSREVQRARAKGLCLDCAQPRAKNRKRCESCLHKQRERRKCQSENLT